MIKTIHVILAVVIVSLLASCGGNTYPDNVTEALKAAGDNRAELEKVIDHYKTEGDSLKLEAALFLIGNMTEHCYVTYRLFDTADATVELDPMSYPNYDALISAVDSIEAERGELDYGKQDRINDVETISADFLINNIDLAFRAWRDKPWATFLTFDQFCRYVLPYRGSNEPLEDWRSYFLEKYEDIGSLVDDEKDAMQVASEINKDVRSWFGFDSRYYFHPTDQGLSEMVASGLGRCEDMTNLAIFALRANGLAVTSDYTPCWANTGNNHAWNAILAMNGKVIPFMGAEADPGSYALHNKAAKVYRKTFDQQPGNLVFQPRKQEEMPRWLAGKYYIDVTADYMDVCDVTVKLEEPVPDSVDFAYICVFNSGHFQPIHWGRIENGSVTFTDMGKDILYLAAIYENEEIVPVGDPFVVDVHCNLLYKSIVPNQQVSLKIDNVPIRAMAASSETVEKAPLTSGMTYMLKYWQNGDWMDFGTFTPKKTSVDVKDLPAGGLYWLTTDNNNEQRIFTVEDGKQIFW
ncbi:MAG: transglutaminase-like domain-containing protein [Candidatus Zixiibacteriota bacterium]